MSTNAPTQLMMGRRGFEPLKLPQRIYSPPPLATREPTRPRAEAARKLVNPKEPATGIEPATYGLQNRCSTVELRRPACR